jgi:hypothetical protein
MSLRDTGFHRNDADWTQGREKAIADAEATARRQSSLMRPVSILRAMEARDVKGEG